MKYMVINRMKNLLPVILVFLTFYACNEDKIFDRELYKNVFALINTDDNDNIFNAVCSMDELETVCYVYATVGGTNPTETDINITLKHDMTLFDHYNKYRFDVDMDQYVNLLPAAYYNIDNYSFTIPKGERGGRMPIRVRPRGLSPDSTYFIPLKVDSYSAYEVNPNKNTLLYRIMLANKYAVQESTIDSRYSLLGTRNGTNILGSKDMQPLDGNRVRTMAGNATFESKLDKIYSNCIILEIGNDNKVKILPYKSIEVNQVDDDPDYPNIFKIENDGFGRTYKTFLLSYQYMDGKTSVLMKEELRLEVK